MVLDVWFEQTTYRLQGDCTTSVLIQHKLLNTIMSLPQSNKLVEKFISTAITANECKFSSSAQRLAYERWLLTGLISSILDTNTYVNFLIKKKIDGLENKIHQKKK